MLHVAQNSYIITLVYSKSWQTNITGLWAYSSVYNYVKYKPSPTALQKGLVIEKVVSLKAIVDLNPRAYIREGFFFGKKFCIWDLEGLIFLEGGRGGRSSFGGRLTFIF